MTETRKFKRYPYQMRRVIICVLIMTLLPFWPAPRPVQAKGLFGWVSEVVPFIGVGVGLHHRNRVYRSSERFIRDRNQYYDGLRAKAWQQLKGNEIPTVGRTRAAAYLKVLVMIEQERAGQLEIAEGRKRQARAQFQVKLKEALVYAAVGSRVAQEVLGSMINGVDKMEQMVDRALNKFLKGDSSFLQDLNRIKKYTAIGLNVSSVFGGKLGAKVRGGLEKVANAFDSAELGIIDAAAIVKAELKYMRGELSFAKEIGRKPSAGEVIDQVKVSFLPEPDQEGSIPLEAIATILSQKKGGDGSLKDEARRALNAGFAARCATYSQTFQAQLAELNKSDQDESAADPLLTSCEPFKPEDKDEQAQDEGVLDQILEYGEDSEEEKESLPRVTASGTLSETMSGALNTSHPMGTTFQLIADFAAGTITGSLNGSRTSTPGGWMNCYDLEDPSIEFDRIDVNTTESYQASFSGSIDKETGEFSIVITPTGQTSATKVSLFTHERCLDLNSKKYSGDQGWNGDGTISGGVSKDGGIEFTTSWVYTWFKGEVQVNGRWSGNGIVENP